MQLPSECLEQIFSYFGDCRPALHNCSKVSHSWRQAVIRLLYRNPWGFLPLPKYGKYATPDEYRIKQLIRTLVSSSVATFPKNEQEFIGSRGTEGYTNYLPLLKVLDLRYMAPWHGDFSLTTGHKVTHKLWKLVRDNCSTILEKLVFVEILSLADVFPLGISYPSLKSICLHIEDFDIAQASVIARACHNIHRLRIRAHYLEDAAIAKVISAQIPQSLKELFLVCDRGIRSVSETINTLIEYHRFSCTELRFSFQSCGLFFTSDNKEAILRISQLPNLRILEFSCCKCVDDECILEIARNCLLLEEIDLSLTSVTMVGITYLMERLGANLKKLVIAQNSNNVVENVVPIIARYCRQLRYLDIRGLPYTVADIRHLSNCSGLSTLVLGNCGETEVNTVDEMLCRLVTECKSLNYLDFGRVPVTEKVVLMLAQHKNLHTIKLNLHTLKLTQSMVESMIAPKIAQFTPF